MNWEENISFVSNKVSSGMYVFRNFKNLLFNRNTLTNVFRNNLSPFKTCINYLGLCPLRYVNYIINSSKINHENYLKFLKFRNHEGIALQLGTLMIPSLYELEISWFKQPKFCNNVKKERNYSHFTISLEVYRKKYHQLNASTSFLHDIGSKLVSEHLQTF